MTKIDIFSGFLGAGKTTLIKKLIRHESKNAENAKTLDELGINNFGTRQALSSTGGRLAKLIVRIDENSVSTEKVDIENESNSENDLSQADDSESFSAENIADEQNSDSDKTTCKDKSAAQNIVTDKITLGSEDQDLLKEKEATETFETINDESFIAGKSRSKNRKSNKYIEEKIDFTMAKFYLNQESISDASKLAEAGGATIFHTILSCLLMVSIYVFIMFLMPSILTFINNFLGN